MRLFIPRRIDSAIRDIAEDHDSGARQLALKALRTLKLCLTIYPMEKASWPEIVNSAWYITQARPSMRTAIHTTILRALHEIQPIYPSFEADLKIDQLITEETAILSRLATNFTNFITSEFSSQREMDQLHILTLSNSSTILAALTYLFKSPSCPRITLNILESRPLLEGVTLAKLLLPHKPPQVSIYVATDAHATFLSSHCHLTVLGCDHLDPATGNVKNKIGSVAATQFTRRTISVTSTDKLGALEDDVIEENDPGEVTKMWGGEIMGINVRNVYFEWVPGANVDGYITERGVLGKTELLTIYEERQRWEYVWRVLD